MLSCRVTHLYLLLFLFFQFFFSHQFLRQINQSQNFIWHFERISCTFFFYLHSRNSIHNHSKIFTHWTWQHKYLVQHLNFFLNLIERVMWEKKKNWKNNLWAFNICILTHHFSVDMYHWWQPESQVPQQQQRAIQLFLFSTCRRKKKKKIKFTTS